MPSMVLGQLDSHLKKTRKLDPYLTPYMEIKSTFQKIMQKTTWNIFMIRRALTTEEVVDKWGYVKTKGSCSLEVALKRVERHKTRCFWRCDLQRGSWENGCET